MPAAPRLEAPSRPSHQRRSGPESSKNGSMPIVRRGSCKLLDRESTDMQHFCKPSDGLEPSTPSLPCDPDGHRWQTVAKDSAGSSRFPPRRRLFPCHPSHPWFSRTFPSITLQQEVPCADLAAVGVQTAECAPGRSLSRRRRRVMNTYPRPLPGVQRGDRAAVGRVALGTLRERRHWHLRSRLSQLVPSRRRRRDRRRARIGGKGGASCPAWLS
jgi:hypothetical protein